MFVQASFVNVVTPDNETSYRIWKDFPRDCIFYERFIVTLGSIVESISLESVIDILLSWLPSSQSYGGQHGYEEYCYEKKTCYPVIEMKTFSV